MENREELRQKGHHRSQRMTCRKGEKITVSDQNIDPWGSANRCGLDYLRLSEKISVVR